MQRKCQKLADRIQAAEETKNYNHIPGSEYTHKELRSGREELYKLGGVLQALKESDNSPLARHNILLAIRKSIQGPQVQNVIKMAAASGIFRL